MEYRVFLGLVQVVWPVPILCRASKLYEVTWPVRKPVWDFLVVCSGYLGCGQFE